MEIVSYDLQIESYDFITMRRRLRHIVAFDVQIVQCIAGVASYDHPFDFVSTRRNKIVRIGARGILTTRRNKIVRTSQSAMRHPIAPPTNASWEDLGSVGCDL